MIDLLPSAEQQQVIDSVAGFMGEKLPLARHRRNHIGGKVDAAIWNEIAGMGWIGLSLPLESGGTGFSIVEEVLAFRELGRYLAPMRIFAGAIAARIAAEVSDSALLAGIVDGSIQAGLVFPGSSMTRTSVGGPVTLLDGGGADVLVGWTEDFGYLLDAGKAAQLAALHPIDPTVDIARLDVQDLKPRCVAHTKAVFADAILLLSAMLVGIAEAARDMAVAYAKQREQFGEPIGGFQAIKHICADMALRAEAAGAATMFAGLKAGQGVSDAWLHVCASKLMATDAAVLNSAANIQVHGGIGFTAECDAHLLIKRSRVIEQLAGSQKRFQSQLALLPGESH